MKKVVFSFVITNFVCPNFSSFNQEYFIVVFILYMCVYGKAVFPLIANVSFIATNLYFLKFDIAECIQKHSCTARVSDMQLKTMIFGEAMPNNVMNHKQIIFWKTGGEDIKFYSLI